VHGRRQFWGGVETHSFKFHAEPVPDLNVAYFQGKQGTAGHGDPVKRANPGRQLLLDISAGRFCDVGPTLPSLAAETCSRWRTELVGGDDNGDEGTLLRGLLAAQEGARLPLGQLLDLDMHGAHDDGAVVLQGGAKLYLPAVPNLKSINTAADGHSGTEFRAFARGAVKSNTSGQPFYAD